MALENGNYAAQPNNRLIWSIPSFTVKMKFLIGRYKLQNGM
jgi:hypothetical protein